MAGTAGKVVAITGAGSGIGEATALLLAERGAKVVLGGRRAERLEDVAKRIIGEGGEAVFAQTDVTRRQDVVHLVEVARERFGRLDVLVNNAGVATVAPLDDLLVDAWDEMVDVNLKGVLHGIGAALPVFRAQGSGHIVTIASTAAFRTVPGQAVYSATKVAVRALCEGLRQEAGENLRVTVVSPGPIATEFVQSAANPQFREILDRIAISADAIARAVAFAVEQPADVDVNEVVVRPTAQS